MDGLMNRGITVLIDLDRGMHGYMDRCTVSELHICRFISAERYKYICLNVHLYRCIYAFLHRPIGT